MRRYLPWVAVALCWLLAIGGPVVAVAQSGGSATKPLYVRPWQGDTRDFFEISCTTAGDVALVSATQGENAMSMYFYNTHGTNFVTICPRAAASGACDNINKGLTLKAGVGLTSDVSVKSAPWSCKGDTTTVVVEVYVERDGGSSLAATPTPIPTPTPTATPTPT